MFRDLIGSNDLEGARKSLLSRDAQGNKGVSLERIPILKTKILSKKISTKSENHITLGDNQQGNYNVYNRIFITRKQTKICSFPY